MKIAFVYKKNNSSTRFLLDSLIESFEEISNVDRFNIIDSFGILNYGILNQLYENREIYDCVFVLDLGFLFDFRIEKSLYKCPVILLTGDDPQNYSPKKNFFLYSKLKQFFKEKLFSLDGEFFYGNKICSKQYDIIFTPDLRLVDRYKKSNLYSFWLPYWFDSKCGFDEHKNTLYDVVTVMSPNKRRARTLRRISRIKNITFKNGVGNYGLDAFNFYGKGRIVFNQSAHNEINIRIFESIGLGIFLLTDRLHKSTGIDLLFSSGIHYETYKSFFDLKRKIIFYLKYPDKRYLIQNTGKNEVLENHTQDNRRDYIIDTLKSIRLEKKNPIVSFLVISWNRPWLLDLTLSSLKSSLCNSNIPFEVILLDQNSETPTKKIIAKHAPFIDKLINVDKNLGISNGFLKMYQVALGKYFIHLENDWFCDSISDQWLRDAIAYLNKFESAGFIKLRYLHDGQFGFGSKYHEPWTVKPFPEDIVDRILLNNVTYYSASSTYNCFTYNPTLIRAELIRNLSHNSLDDPENSTPLRSGEDALTKLWRSQSDYTAATLLNGPFRHLGHHSLRNHLITNIKYYLVYKINSLILKMVWNLKY